MAVVLKGQLLISSMSLPVRVPVLVTVAVIVSVLSSALRWPLCSALRTVTHLPFFDGPLPFHLETGYLEVDEENGGNLFYYFAKSENNPERDPLIVWHSGGPGCSVLSALVTEIGPLKVDVVAYNEHQPWLIYNPHTWTKMSNIIFVDSPIGTGFSYSRSPEGYYLTDTKAALQFHTFIEKWFSDHPEFLANPLYIGGDSYAGVVTPIVAQEIVNRNYDGATVNLNLKGYLTGNSRADKRFDNLSIPYAHRMGLLSDELYESAKQNCDGNYDYPSSENCAKSLLPVLKCILALNYEHILEPTSCDLSSLKPHITSVNTNRSTEEHGRMLADLKSSLPIDCEGPNEFLLMMVWANRNHVREALGIREGTVEGWVRCKQEVKDRYTKDVPSTLKFHRNLTTGGYRALVYSGDHDLIVPYMGTQAWIRSLNFSVTGQWRPWFLGRQIVGYTTTYSDYLTFATVKGAGHNAPQYKPKECQSMVARWLSNEPL